MKNESTNTYKVPLLMKHFPSKQDFFFNSIALRKAKTILAFLSAKGLKPVKPMLRLKWCYFSFGVVRWCDGPG